MRYVDCVQIYRGYVDDPRNTDNAWMETIAMNFHDDEGHSVAHFRLHAGMSGMVYVLLSVFVCGRTCACVCWCASAHASVCVCVCERVRTPA